VEELRLGRKERRRMKVLEEVKRKRIALADAAAILKLSYRQASRIWLRYRTEGDGGLVHRGQGRRPNNAIDEELKMGFSIAIGSAMKALARRWPWSIWER
jgi:hypothetical protein